METSFQFYKETEFKEVELNGRVIEIPKDWDVVRLGNIVEIYDSKRIPLSEQERAKRKGSYPYCGATGIIDYVDDYIFDGEYVLLAEDGGFFGPFEQSAYIMSGKFWVNNHAHVLKAKDDIANNWYVMYVLNYIDLRPYIVGSTRTKLNQADMRRIKIPLPPLEEQKKIAHVLRTIDNAIEIVDKAIEKLERIKKATMEQLLTKGIGHREFKKVKLDGRVIEIPKDWEVVRLEELAERSANSFVDGPFGSNLKVDDFIDCGIPVIQLHNIGEGFFNDKDIKYISENKFNELIRHETRPYDVVIAKIGDTDENGKNPIARACVVPDKFDRYMIVADCVRLRPNKKIVHPYFLQFIINSRIVRRQAISLAKGTTRKRINLSEIKTLRIPLPPLEEQKQIAKILKTIGEAIELKKKKKEKLKRMKKAVMDKLLTGKVRIK